MLRPATIYYYLMFLRKQAEVSESTDERNIKKENCYTSDLKDHAANNTKNYFCLNLNVYVLFSLDSTQ